MIPEPTFLVRMVNLDVIMCAPIPGLDNEWNKFEGSFVRPPSPVLLPDAQLKNARLCVSVGGGE
jgi:hypothetical protein